ncbi:hypothetical protein JCM14076_11760 [Methylosoma difficile]
MLFLDFYKENIGTLSPYQEAGIDALLMALLSAPLLWFFVLRKLVVQIDLEQGSTLKQTRLNAELRNALDSHALVSIANANGRIIHANPKFCEVSGYTEEELIDQDHRIINSGYHDKAYIRNMWQTISEGNIWHGVFCNRRKNGELYWVDSTITPLKDEYGLIYQYISIRQDITPQKLANERRIMLERAVNASADMILLTDAYGSIQFVNPALCLHTGWTEAALIGKNPDILDSPNCDKTATAQLQDALVRGDSWSGRLLLKRKGISPVNIAGQATPPNPLEFWVELNISPVRNFDGSLAGYVQIQRDISEQVQEEIAQQMEIADSAVRLGIASILQQEQPLAVRFTQALDILFSLQNLDLQCKGGIFLRSQTDNYLEMFVLRGEFSKEFIEKEQRVALGDCLCGRAAASGELLISDDCFCDPRHEHTFEGMKAHGHYIVPIVAAGEVLGIAFLYTMPYPTHSSKRIGMLKEVGEMLGLAVLQDRAKTSLENARDMAMQAALSKSEFLANMSHEIRTPMNGVLGMLDLLRDTDMSNTQWNLVETAYDSAEALLAILNDILDFSKLEAGKVELEQIDFHLLGLVEDVCSLLANHAHAKELELTCFIANDIPCFWQGDPARIRQILTNLIGNAIKFTEQGEVSITVKHLRGPNGYSRVLFEVCDTGIGITETAQAQLFQAFSQAESSTSRRFGGTGLGLSICKKMVELMEGEIGVQSTLGKGSCFWFSLPLTLGQAIENYSTPIDIIGKRALIVDDNATNRTILHHYLTHWGFIATEMDGSLAALEELHYTLAKDKPYDLVLMDMHMPQMDGLALARTLSETPLLNEIPRIMLTSGSLLSESDRRRLGLAQSLLKPVKQSQLFDAILNALNHSEQPITARSKHPPISTKYEGKKVLVVEDNKVNQKVIIGMLAKFNLVPEITDNGQLAFDLLIQNTYDLILMDCQMPVMDGYQTTRELRLMESGCGFPRQIVVALTANSNTGEREKCLEAGMDDYLSKPFNQEQLAAKLERWFNPNNAPDQEIVADNSAEPVAPLDTLVWDKAAALENLTGDEELLQAMLGAFLEEAPGQLSDVQTAAAAHNLPELAKAAHSLKGSLSYLGSETTRACAANIEALARTAESADYPQLAETLLNETNSLMAIFRQFLTNKNN